MKLYLYDLDKTLIKEDSAKLWADFIYEKGLVGAEFVAAQEAYEDDYANGVLDMDEYQKHFLAPIKGKTKQDIKPLLSEFVDKKIKGIVYDDAIKLVNSKAGKKIVISATNDFIVQVVCEFLHIDEFLATDSQIQGGVYTGNIDGIAAFRDGKVKKIKSYVSKDEFENATFYSDSINDLPLLKAVKIGVLVNPDKLLLEENEKLKFDILRFEK